MYQVTQELAFCYGHRLLGHPGKCARLHGHNALVFVTLQAERLDGQGMVADFDAIERRVRAYVEETLDHRMLLQRDDPVGPALQRLGEPYVALDFPPTAETLARLLFEVVEAAGLPVVEVRLLEQPGSVASFRR